MAVKTSPLAPSTRVTLPSIDGVRIATAEAGIKYAGRTDLMLMVFDRPAAVAGVFTRSQCASAPVEWCRRYLDGGVARALVVNSGNANAFTGLKGEQASRQTAEAAADAVGCLPGEVFLSSTGVIGEPLLADRFTGLLGDMEQNARAERWPDAASSIMTTDTFAKLATRQAKISGRDVTLNGIAKGSGMIAPDMATMLAYVVTDAPVPAGVLQVLLNRAVSTSFNAITVDGDTSTSDTLMAFAVPPPGSLADREPAIEDADDERLAEFHEALKSLALDLALQIVRDGEGASKFVEIRVTGASSDQSARTIALSVANSPLVKTAIAGEDANWGRIVMAVGKAGEPADRDRLSIWFGDVQVAREGERDPDYSEDRAAAVMTGQEIVIRVDLGLGDGEFRAYTCDLTHDYITINADYRS